MESRYGRGRTALRRAHVRLLGRRRHVRAAARRGRRARPGTCPSCCEALSAAHVAGRRMPALHPRGGCCPRSRSDAGRRDRGSATACDDCRVTITAFNIKILNSISMNETIADRNSRSNERCIRCAFIAIIRKRSDPAPVIPEYLSRVAPGWVGNPRVVADRGCSLRVSPDRHLHLSRAGAAPPLLGVHSTERGHRVQAAAC